MSIYASQMAVDTYTSSAKAAYQSGSKSRDRVRTAPNVGGKSHRFTVIGKGKTQRRPSQAPVVPINLTNANPVAYLAYRDIHEFLDIQDSAVLTVDAAAEYGDAVGFGLARSFDAEVFAALNEWNSNAYEGSLSSSDRDMNVATAGTITPKEIAERVSTLMNRGVKKRDDITWFLAWDKFPELADAEKLSSSDYIQGNMVTQELALSRVYGCTVRLIDNDARDGTDDGALPANTSFFCARNAVGLAWTDERLATMEWRADIKSEQFGASAHVGATRIDNTGIIRIGNL